METESPISRLAVFRVDGGSTIGGGHVVRCRALAETLQRAGWRCGLAATAETLTFFPKLSPIFLEHTTLGDNEPEGMAARWPNGCDLLVVDHYKRDNNFETACRPWARRILVIDDLADRPHCCDLLLDGTRNRKPAEYEALAPKNCTLMLGTDFLPLRADFASRRRKLLPRTTPKPPWRVHLNLGAAPDIDLLLNLIDSLNASKLDLSLQVSVGTMPKSDVLQSRLNAIGGRLNIATDDMAYLIEDADIAIGAAGMSAWERACLGLPAIILVLADNQKENAESFAETGAAHVIEISDGVDSISNAISEIVGNHNVWRSMSTAATRMCDGLGVARVVEMIEERSAAKDGVPVHLRPATLNDAPLMYEWQTDTTTRQFSRNPAVPTCEEHMAWFAAKHVDPGCIFNVITHNGEAAGVVRLDRMDDRDVYEVSILVAPEHRRAGVSRAALDLTRRLVPDVDLRAFVKPENGASLALFEAAGYAKAAEPDWYVHQNREGRAHG
jgi:UDP-2,4-diacetamido-2,4,6-trideoxy-beta-L-altropyranose hydrolase